MQTTDSFSKAIILGATGGIGRHLATELAKHLDFLVLVGRNPDKLVQLQKELAGSKAQLSIKVLNLCDKEALENFGKALDADLLVNCAGLASFSIGSDLATETEQELWQVNYHAPVQLMKLLVQKNQKIRLVQLSSLAALFPHPYLAAYSASKAAVCNLTQWLATYLADVGIRVNAIAPGFFATKINRRLLFNEDGSYTERSKKIISGTPMDRFGEPKELVGAMLYLCDHTASGFVTGVILPVDGGFSAYCGV